MLLGEWRRLVKINNFWFVCLFGAMAGVFTGSAPAVADEVNPMLNARYAIWLGGFFPEVDSQIRINGKIIGDGDNIDLEKVLGLESSKSVFWGGASWRISNRNNLEIELANLNRNGSTTVQSNPIEIGDSIAIAGAQIDTSFDITLARLTYGFSVVRSEKMDVRLKAGLHILDLSSSLQLTGAVCVDGQMPPNCPSIGPTPRLEGDDVTAPLPHVGMSFSYAFSPGFAVRAQVIGFAVKLDSIDGSLVEIDADAVYNPWRHFGLGAGVRYFNADVQSKGSRLNGEFNFQYFGPVVYGKFTF